MRNKKSHSKEVTSCGNSDFPYHKELLSLWEQIFLLREVPILKGTQLCFAVGMNEMLRALKFYSETNKEHHNSSGSIFVCLFDLIFYVSSTIFQLNRDGSSWVEPVLS